MIANETVAGRALHDAVRRATEDRPSSQRAMSAAAPRRSVWECEESPCAAASPGWHWLHDLAPMKSAEVVFLEAARLGVGDDTRNQRIKNVPPTATTMNATALPRSFRTLRTSSTGGCRSSETFKRRFSPNPLDYLSPRRVYPLIRTPEIASR